MEVPGKEGEDNRNGVGWISSGTTCRREHCQGGSCRPGKMEASRKKHRPHIKVGNDAEEEEEELYWFATNSYHI